MSELRVDSVKSKGGGAPDLPKGVTISGIATAATLGATTVDVSNVNVSGVVTSGTLSGSLLSTGTPTLGLGVTINSSGLHISGVATAGIVSATTLYGDGSNLTGIAATIAPLFYNPDLSDSLVAVGTGIGITFNQQIKAGTGNITIRETNASGTVVENFGVGSSVTISENRISFTPSSDLTAGQVYHLSYPSGCFTNNEGTDYVGTAYTFVVKPIVNYLWAMGASDGGQLGDNTSVDKSSPIQIPGSTWRRISGGETRGRSIMATKTDNTLWIWGETYSGGSGLNQSSLLRLSSPTQIPGTTCSDNFDIGGYTNAVAVKTDGTLWTWGTNSDGALGLNQTHNQQHRSSPVQIGSGTDWSTTAFHSSAGGKGSFAIKTDGTLWGWGYNDTGQLAQNNVAAYSSPVQIPGTNWNFITKPYYSTAAIKTDGTLWTWGTNAYGNHGNNEGTNKSSPVQVPGTTWKKILSGNYGSIANKTDGTLWYIGSNQFGSAGQNLPMGPGPSNSRSSPIQITSGTDWNDIAIGMWTRYASKTDGTLYGWGRGDGGSLGTPTVNKSSPTQIPGTDWTGTLSSSYGRTLFNLRPGD
jgi:hypothetical protein